MGGRPRQRRWRRVLVAGFAGTLLIAGGCGDDTDKDGSAADAAQDDSSTTSAQDTTDDGGNEGEVPDPCSLLSTDELTSMLGADPGEGTVQGPVPDQRKVCTFEGGTILSVEVAANWDASLELIREQFGADALEAVPGVGEAAYWQANGVQFLALGDVYFVGVTGPPDQGAAQGVAEAMLDAV